MGCATALTGAAARGDLKEVNKLLDEGADLNEIDGHKQTAIKAAAVRGKTNMVRLLAERGADLNCKPPNSEACTPLHMAAAMGHIDTVRTLIEKGADVNAKDKHNWTPLHYAISKNDAETVRILVQAGSDLEAQANRKRLYSGGGTVLQMAQGRKDIERILMEAEKEKPKSYAKTEPPYPKVLSQPAVEKGMAKDLPKIAVWDLSPREVKPTYAQELTAILVSEMTKIKKYEVYSQDNVRTLAGWTEERMKLGCTSTQCLTALGQMDIGKLISGSVGKIGNTFSISLNLFDTQNAKAEKAVSQFCRTEDELIPLLQMAVRELLGEEVPPVNRGPRR